MKMEKRKLLFENNANNTISNQKLSAQFISRLQTFMSGPFHSVRVTTWIG